MEGEISPERDWLTREIPVTSWVIGSQEIPEKLQGDSRSFQLCRVFSGSFNCLLNCRRACVSTVKAVESWKRGKKKRVIKKTLGRGLLLIAKEVRVEIVIS